MTTRDALYAEILDDPHADTPRKVLADWLDDHDEPERAEFIRVQVELSQNSVPVDATPAQLRDAETRMGRETWDALRRRERELLPSMGPRWFGAERLDATTIHDHDPIRWYIPGVSDYVACGTSRRGFPDEVRLSLAAFVGGECGRCGGDGRAHGSDRPFEGPPGPCSAKCDRGRVPGLARELFAAHPITRVVLTDREPFGYLDAPKWGWSVSAGSHDRGEASWLPDDVWGKTIDARTPGREGPNVWATRDDALAALSDAAVAYGRELEGLRPIRA